LSTDQRLLFPRLLAPLGRRGQIMPIFALMFLFLFGIVALALDAGHLFLANLQVQNAVDSAALAAGKTLALQAQTAPPGSSSNAAVQSAHDFANLNGFPTQAGALCETATSSQFQTSFFDTSAPGSCGAAAVFNTRVDIYVPPLGSPTPNCAARPFNCVQVQITRKVPTYLMSMLGVPWTNVAATATAYAQPPGSFSNYPPQYAVYLYQPQAACPAGNQCFNESLAPSRSNMSCAAPNNCPTLWGRTLTQPLIKGYDGSLSAASDTVAVQSKGDIVVEDTGGMTICDPYNGATCVRGAAVGAKGFALATGASLRCNGGTTQPLGLPACSLPLPTLGAIYGNEISPMISQAWYPTLSLPQNDCGFLVLNGEQVQGHSGLTGATGCQPSNSEKFTIMPGKYSYIVINHGMYEFAGGLFEITGSAPAGQIDHSLEGVADWDLCNPVIGCNTTAGIWITHGAGTGNPGSSGFGSCGGASSQAGGGDLTQILGVGVTFRFDAGAGGFVSSRLVTSIVLIAPGFGANPSVNDIPLLFDLENSNFIHLDAIPAPLGFNPNRFQGIIYQANPLTSSVTGGGLEIDAGAAAVGGGTPLVLGQVIAYSLTTFGLPGIAVDFTNGLAGGSMPVFNTGGLYEPSQLAGVALQPVVGDPTKEKVVLNYFDEFDLDAFDVYLKINNGPAIYFSKGLWPTSPVPPANNNPGNANPAYPTAAGAATYTVVASSPKPDWTYIEPDGTKYEVSGDWSWGHQMDLIAAGKGLGTGILNQAATITYTFPIPAGNTVVITAYMTDGDFCGDFVAATWTFYNIGQSGAGQQVAGNVHLEQ
jgi:Putative Flp pilus-assembly TadE/G-like